ncbi:MAG: hypothetical protein HYT20_01195 [Candidatus Nealsonbacteria bacterium]|nr:hypothetical protein [Candidatus Nealsonbacteria bacterium]
MAQIFKNHKWAIFLALATAIVVAYPQIYSRWDLGDSYQGIGLMGASDDESAWMSRVKEVQDGHPAFSSTYFKDGKSDPYLFQPLGTIIVAYSGQLFSLNINDTILFSRLFFTSLLFLIIYAFLFFFTKEKIISLSIPSVFLLAISIFNRGATLKPYYLLLTRPVNPALTWIFFFGFLLFFWLFIERKQWRWGILSALILGLSFYDFLYTWTFLYAFCGILILIFLCQKKWQDIKRIAVVLLGAILIAIPYFINLYRAAAYPTFGDVGARAGLMGGRELSMGILPPMLLVLFLILFPRKWKERYYFALALVIAPFVVLNQQLITGKALSPSHYHWYYHKPLALIILLIILFSVLSLRKWQFAKKALAIFFIVISISLGIFVQSISYSASKETIVKIQKYGPLMDWFNKNAKKEEVVFSNDAIANLIVTHTSLNVFYHHSAKYSLSATTERLINTFFLYYRLDGVAEAQAKDVFLGDKENISWAIYGIYYRDLFGEYENIPDGVVLDLVRRYQESFAAATPDLFNEMLQKYEVNYLIWDKESNPKWQLDQYPFLKKAAEIGEFIIYER